MKTILSLALICLSCLSGLAQVPYSSALNSTLDPLYNRGYIVWEGMGADATYEVTLARGTETIKTFRTEKNYLWLNVEDYRDATYTIAAFDKQRGNPIGIGDTDIIAPVPPDYIGKVVTCEKTCNGPDYAYTLQLLHDDVPNSAVTDPAIMSLTNAYDYIDANGIGIPFYQAMAPAQFQANSAVINTQNYDYYSTVLPINSGVTDAQNNPMTGLTYFVEKRLKQYQYMRNNTTTLFNPNSSTICSFSLTGPGGWINIFHSHADPNNAQPDPQLNEPATLGCASTGFGGGPTHGGLNGNWGPMPNANVVFFPCEQNGTVQISAGGLIIAIIDCEGFGTIAGTLGGIHHFDFQPLDADRDNIQVDLSGNSSTTLSDLELADGLYRMHIVFNSGHAIPFVFEKGTPPASTPTFDFHLYPNPGPGMFYVNLPGPSTGTLEVLRPNGELIGGLTQQFSNAEELRFDLGRQQQGYYFVRITVDGTTTSKIIYKN